MDDCPAITESDKKEILHGISFGVDILDCEDKSKIKSVEIENHRSATCPERREKVEALLLEEIALGHYQVVSEKPTIVNAIGAVDKPDAKDEVRLIMDASLPKLHSLNSYADPPGFNLEGVDDAVKYLNKDWFQAKIDLKRGYRSVPICPTNFEFTGLKWKFISDNSTGSGSEPHLQFFWQRLSLLK